MNVYLMKTRVIIFIGILFFVYPTYAISNTYNCDVVNMTTTSLSTDKRDKDFVSKNLKNKYLISTKEKHLILSQTGDSNKKFQQTFNIVKNDMFGIVGVIDKRMWWEIFFFDKTNLKATLSLQGSIFVNAWELSCKRI